MNKRIIIAFLLFLSLFLVITRKYWLSPISHPTLSRKGDWNTDSNNWDTYHDKKGLFIFKYPKEWLIDDITDSMRESSATGDYYQAVIDFYSPDYNSYYTGGDWGYTVNESGMLVRIVVSRPTPEVTFPKSYEALKNSEMRDYPQNVFKEVTYNEKLFLIEYSDNHRPVSAHTVVNRPNGSLIYYNIKILNLGDDRPGFHKSVFEDMLRNLVIYY